MITDEAKKSPSGVAPEGQKSVGRLEPSRRVGNDGDGYDCDDGHCDHAKVGGVRGERRAVEVHLRPASKPRRLRSVKSGYGADFNPIIFGSARRKQRI